MTAVGGILIRTRLHPNMIPWVDGQLNGGFASRRDQMAASRLDQVVS